MRCGIYMITCVPTGKRYVGSSHRIEGRWVVHRSELRGGYHSNPQLQKAWRKHGESSFKLSILEECAEADLIEREQHYIDTLRPEFNAWLDLVDSPMRGRRHTPEACAKISAAHKGRVSNRKGVKMSESQKAKISAALKGRPGNRKGSKMPEGAKRRISEALRGNTHKRGKPASEETKAKMRAAQRRRRQREKQEHETQKR